MKKKRLMPLIIISLFGCLLAACGEQAKHADAQTERSTAQKYESTISAGMTSTVGLKTDGTVVACGNNKYGECDLSDWSDIVSIAVGSFHTIGIQSDGRVVVKGDDRSGQSDIAGWTDIAAVAADTHSVGLKNDGTVVAAGSELDNRCDVSAWTNIGSRE